MFIVVHNILMQEGHFKGVLSIKHYYKDCTWYILPLIIMLVAVDITHG